MRNFLRKFDAFGKPVSLTHEGMTTYSTSCGGCVTILLAIVVTLGLMAEFHANFTEPDFTMQLLHSAESWKDF